MKLIFFRKEQIISENKIMQDIIHYRDRKARLLKSTDLLINIKLLFFSSLIFLFSVSCFADKPMSVLFADSEISRHPDIYARWDYVTGTVLKAFENVWIKSGDKKYYDYIKKTVDAVVTEDGKIDGYDIHEYNIDQIAEGRAILMLYKQTGEEKYKKAAQLLREQFKNHPRTSEGGFWHKQIYPNQMWLDGLWMGAPFYAEYASIFNEPEIFDDVTKQFILIYKHLRDEKSGLYYHAWDESKSMFWADKNTGLSKNFWGRGMGWYFMALVDVLDYLPKEHPKRDSLILIAKGLAEALTKVQDKQTGLWWQVLDQGKREGNYLEGSASSMFVYAIAKSVRMKYIDKKYYDIAKKGYEGIIKHLIILDSRGNYNLTRICNVAGLGGKYKEKIRDGSFEYYAFIEPIVANDGKGTGPFIMACIEIEMAQNK